MTTQTRFRVKYDDYYQFEECDGGPMPMPEEAYEGNEYHKDGVIVPYVEYLKYYGNPDRHVVLSITREDRCLCCGSWVQGDSLYGIDFMDDDKDLQYPDTYMLDELKGYLREVASDLGADECIRGKAV